MRPGRYHKWVGPSRSGSLTLWTLLILSLGLSAGFAMARTAQAVTAQQRLYSAMQTAAITLERQDPRPTFRTQEQFATLVQTNLQRPKSFVLNAFRVVPVDRRYGPRWEIWAIGEQVLPPEFQFPGLSTHLVIRAQIPTP